MYPHLYSYNQLPQQQEQQHGQQSPYAEQQPRSPHQRQQQQQQQQQPQQQYNQPEHYMPQMHSGSNTLNNNVPSFGYMAAQDSNTAMPSSMNPLPTDSNGSRILAHQFNPTVNASIRGNDSIESLSPSQTPVKSQRTVDMARDGAHEQEYSNLGNTRANSGMPSLSHLGMATRHEASLGHTYENTTFDSHLESGYGGNTSQSTLFNSTTVAQSSMSSIPDLSTTLPPLNPDMDTRPLANRQTERNPHPWADSEGYNGANGTDDQVLRTSQAKALNNAHDLQPYGCDVPGCFATFPDSSGLFYHIKSLHPDLQGVEKPYRCAMPNCTKRYKNINGLQYHLREAKGSSGHPTFSSLSQSSGGEPTTALKSYKCNVPGCKKAYRTANGLRYHHMHVHNGPPTA